MRLVNIVVNHHLKIKYTLQTSTQPGVLRNQSTVFLFYINELFLFYNYALCTLYYVSVSTFSVHIHICGAYIYIIYIYIIYIYIYLLVHVMDTCIYLHLTLADKKFDQWCKRNASILYIEMIIRLIRIWLMSIDKLCSDQRTWFRSGFDDRETKKSIYNCTALDAI